MINEQAVATHSAQDTALAARVPGVVPEGWEDFKFRSVAFPTGGMFAILKGDDSYWGPFTAEDFYIEENHIATAHDHRTGEPVVLRVIEQSFINDPRRAFLKCVTDDGEEVGYILEFIPDNTLEIQEPVMGQEMAKTS